MHVELEHNKYKINKGGYQDFREEPLVRGFPSDIETAFEIFEHVNFIGFEETVKFIDEIKEKS